MKTWDTKMLAALLAVCRTGVYPNGHHQGLYGNAFANLSRSAHNLQYVAMITAHKQPKPVREVLRDMLHEMEQRRLEDEADICRLLLATESL